MKNGVYIFQPKTLTLFRGLYILTQNFDFYISTYNFSFYTLPLELIMVEMIEVSLRLRKTGTPQSLPSSLN